MALHVEGLPDRVAAALVGAAAGEDAAGSPAGVRQLFGLGEALADAGGVVDQAELVARGFDQAPAGGPAGLLLRALLCGLLTPLDRPRLRQGSHRLVTLARGDEGTAITAVAAGVLAADLCRFDLDTALVRLRQTLLEEAPAALHIRLHSLGWTEVPMATGDPGASLQLAITALERADGIEAVVDQASRWEGDVAATAALAGALAGARDRFEHSDPDWLERIPGRARALDVAALLAPHVQSGTP